KVLGISATFWIAREQNYREALARVHELETLSREADWLDQIPYRAMVKLGWIVGHPNKAFQLQELLRFFGVASPASWKGLYNAFSPAFRQSRAFTIEPGAIAAWLRKGEIDAARQHCQEFSANAFKQALTRIRGLTRDLPRSFTHVLMDECCGAGVCVV